MLGAALALIILGLIALFILPWVGIGLGVVGLVLLILFLVGFGRRAAQTEGP